MVTTLINIIEKVKSQTLDSLRNEASISMAVILPILGELGWDTCNPDEVFPEYPLFGGKVDFALMLEGKPKIFIEVKKNSENLEDHQEQLLQYSFKAGVGMAVLTNGISCWFYLPLKEGSWDQRKCFSIEMMGHEVGEIAHNFQAMLSKEAVENGTHIRFAEDLHSGIKKRKEIREAIPKAWTELIREVDEGLVELISDKTEKICGFRPDAQAIEEFLAKVSRIEPPPTSVSSSLESLGPPESDLYTFQKPRQIVVLGILCELKSWKEVLIRTCEVLAKLHADDFGKVLSIRGKKRKAFSQDRYELKAPQKIGNTNIYAETNLSANSIVERCHKLLSLFGHNERDLAIEYKKL